MKTITLPTTLGALSLALLLSGAVPATAAANNRNSPSGNSPSDNSAISQYIESVPTAGGGKPSGGVKSHRGGRPGLTLAYANARGIHSPRAFVRPGRDWAPGIR